MVFNQLDRKGEKEKMENDKMRIGNGELSVEISVSLATAMLYCVVNLLIFLVLRIQTN
jgi:hypothetical protein